MSGAYTHRPVLLEEAIQGLAIRPDGVYVDGTLGRGGHSEAIVRGLTAGGRLLCIDRDSQALEEGRARLAPWAGQITFLHGNFGDLAALLDGGKKVAPVIAWKDGLPDDEAEMVQTEAVAVGAGITSKLSAMKRAYGYDDDQAEEELKRIAAEEPALEDPAALDGQHNEPDGDK